MGIRTIFQGKALLVRTRLSNMAIFVPRRTSPEEPKAYSWLSYRGRPSVSPGLGKDKTSGHGLAYKESINPEAGVFWTSELSKNSSAFACLALGLLATSKTALICAGYSGRFKITGNSFCKKFSASFSSMP